MTSDFPAIAHHAALDARLDEVTAEWDARSALGIVIAAHGYPETPRTGDVIEGLNASSATDTRIFHAGTKLCEDGSVVTAGGRVLTVCALGETVAQAQSRALQALKPIRIEGAFHRRDIGWRAIAREKQVG